MPASGGQAKRLTDLPLGVMPASWSPDSKRLLFAARIPNAPPPKDTEPRKRWEQRPRHVTRAQYKADGQGYIFDSRAHIFIADVSDGSLRQITHVDVDDRAECWSPDGQRIASVRNRPGRGDYNQSDLYI
ncbi:MAG: hypothetical protein E6J52_10700, partial [Chloroflexi bacterium]